MSDVQIIIGSTSDQQTVKESGMLTILDKIGIDYQLSVISAHRNPEVLTQHCKNTLKETFVYIGIAGMSAALPGAIAANTNMQAVVLGIALSSEKHPHHYQAALSSIICMPPGVPLGYTGSDSPGMINAAILACQIIAINRPKIEANLKQWLKETTKKARIGIL
jgi:5-(carboxyamino)imidazole ribonucleotide mutase